SGLRGRGTLAARWHRCKKRCSSRQYWAAAGVECTWDEKGRRRCRQARGDEGSVAERTPPLRSLATTFAAPAVPGGVTLESSALRQGRNVNQFKDQVLQDVQVAGLPGRASRARDGRTSASIRTSGCAERHLVDAGPPFSASDRSSFPGWMRF